MKKQLLIITAIILILAAVEASAQNIPPASQIFIHDDRLVEAIETILGYVEGAVGAIIMVLAGIFAIVSAAFGQYRAALALFIVAVGAFILRAFIIIFFQTTLGG